jgi:hypothetical protein
VKYPADKFDAINEITKIAERFDLCVSIVTVDDVLTLKGVTEPEPTDQLYNSVVDSWEWRHYGEGWTDWFDGLEIDDEN